MSRQPASATPFTGTAFGKEVCPRIRLARSAWDAHSNPACRRERERALALYATLDEAAKYQVLGILRVWARSRSENYFGPNRTPPGTGAAQGVWARGGGWRSRLFWRAVFQAAVLGAAETN